MTEPAPEDQELTSVARVNRMLTRAPDEADSDDAQVVAEVVEAVNSLCPLWMVKPADGWAAHHHLGATMLAARLYRRKDSPGGVVDFGMEGAAYVSGNWPDVALLLGIGATRVGRPG